MTDGVRPSPKPIGKAKMGLLLIVLGLLIWLLFGAGLIGLILIIVGLVVLCGGFATGRRYY